ncbi:helix-turn-helix transcriptional regulator [Asticcacaulis sp. ZE23SCel15]|uniref:helix-turn-helix transcriptional regulator n=1 Tax=Asticcacaulis sp. ZE23SCel15 TaxID=3059027 RepID=UPI00265EE829|nr:helix-turn-helix transcriptional regulator [Asticcacaulis sp. ZE23SCel15]WKL56462.1 helix-turn-helix transcriptional regulator [Asticcacaulis sp. ZE23SCel15]
MSVLKNHLKEYRSARNLTQADLAVMAGVSRKTINTIENEVFVPSAILALKLAHVLECRVEDLFYLEGIVE